MRLFALRAKSFMAGRRSTSNRSGTVQAAGRMLSGKNAESIKTGLGSIKNGCRSIAQVLVTAGAIDKKYIDADYMNGGDEEDDSEEVESAASVINASNFTDSVATNAWFKRLQTTLETFLDYYRSLHLADLKEIAQWVDPEIKTEADRQRSIAETLTEFETLLTNLSAQYPNLGDGASAYSSYYYNDMEMAASDVQAGALTDMVERRTWIDYLYNALSEFRRRYQSLHTHPLTELKDIETDEDRRAAIATLIREMRQLLDEHSAGSPPMERSIYASAQTRNQAQAFDGEVLDPQSLTPAVTSTFVEGQLINANALSLDTAIVVDAEISAGQAQIQIDVEANGNLHPIRGVLFRVDEVSESVPSVGPGLPLYIPRDVAERCLNVANMPLEASEDLAAHDHDGTCGVMASAEIVNNDFSVSGYLWNYNHSEKVAAILAAQEKLGMSMNARAKGKVAIVNGTKAFWVTDLELLGGCILLAKLATYQKTQFKEAITASAQPPSSRGKQGRSIPQPPRPTQWQRIAAEASPPVSPQSTHGDPDEMPIDPAVQAQLNAFSSALEQQNQTISAGMQQLQTTVGNLAQSVGVLQEDRQAAIQASQQLQQQQLQQQQQQQLVEALGTVLGKQFQDLRNDIPTLVRTEVSTAVRDTRYPARRTVPVVAQGNAGGVDPSNMMIQLELARLEGEITQIQATPIVDNVELMRKLDRKRELEASLQMQTA